LRGEIELDWTGSTARSEQNLVPNTRALCDSPANCGNCGTDHPVAKNSHRPVQKPLHILAQAHVFTALCFFLASILGCSITAQAPDRVWCEQTPRPVRTKRPQVLHAHTALRKSNQHHTAGSLLKSWESITYPKKSPHFMEAQGSLPSPQERCILLYTETAESSPHTANFPKIYFNNILPSMLRTSC
jgi:hypothetical protein